MIHDNYSAIEEPTRVLHVTDKPIGKGGLEMHLLNLYQFMDRRSFQFDCVTPARCHNEGFRRIFEMLGGELVELGGPARGPRRYFRMYRAIRKCLKKVPVDIIHVDSGEVGMLAAASLAARRGGAPVVIAHTQRAPEQRLGSRLARFLCAPILRRCPTHRLASSEQAFRWAFPKQEYQKELLAPGAIRPDQFRFNPEIRRELREKTGLRDAFVVGHVGAFTREKNHAFLLEIFQGILKQDSSAMLLLIGEGELLEATRARAEAMGISRSVVFYGASNQVRILMQAMDLFLLPSRAAGLCMTALEAQAAGLPTLASDVLPGEVRLTPSLETLSLKESAEEWARQARRMVWTQHRREDGPERITAAGYDCSSAARRMGRFYTAALDASRLEREQREEPALLK